VEALPQKSIKSGSASIAGSINSSLTFVKVVWGYGLLERDEASLLARLAYDKGGFKDMFLRLAPGISYLLE